MAMLVLALSVLARQALHFVEAVVTPITDLQLAIGSSVDVPCPSGMSRIAAGSGWDSDFNDGAGGNYVYLCMGRNNASVAPISGLVVVTSPHDRAPMGGLDCPDGYEQLPGNLASGSTNPEAVLCVSRGTERPAIGLLQGVLAATGCPAGFEAVWGSLERKPLTLDPRGKRLLLCHAPVPAPRPIVAISVLVSSAAHSSCPDGYARVGGASEAATAWDEDFNQGAKGLYVYLCVATANSTRAAPSSPAITSLVAFTTPSDAQPFGDCPKGMQKAPGVGANGSSPFEYWEHSDLNHGSANIGAMYLCYEMQPGQPAISALVGVAGAVNATACPGTTAPVNGTASQGRATKAFDFDPKGSGLRLCASRMASPASAAAV